MNGCWSWHAATMTGLAAARSMPEIGRQSPGRPCGTAPAVAAVRLGHRPRRGLPFLLSRQPGIASARRGELVAVLAAGRRRAARRTSTASISAAVIRKCTPRGWPPIAAMLDAVRPISPPPAAGLRRMRRPDVPGPTPCGPLDGARHPLAGVLPVETAMLESSRRWATPKSRSPATRCGARPASACRGHEFHYSEIAADRRPAATAGGRPTPPASPQRDGPAEGFAKGARAGRLRPPALGLAARQAVEHIPLPVAEGTIMNEATRSGGHPHRQSRQPAGRRPTRVRRHGRRIAAPAGRGKHPAGVLLHRPAEHPDRVAELAARGVRRIVLLPYFLYTGQHVTRDIPALLDQCRAAVSRDRLGAAADAGKRPGLGGRGGRAARGRLRVAGRAAHRGRGNPAAQLSRSSPRSSTRPASADAAGRKIVERSSMRRPIFPSSARYGSTPRRSAAAGAALAAGRPVLCDVTMLQAGMTQVRNEVVCAIADPQVAALAAREAVHAGGRGHGIARRPGWPARSWPSATPPRLGSCWKSSAAAGRGRRWWSACRWAGRRTGSETGAAWQAICVTSPTSRPAAAAPPRPRPSTPWPPRIASRGVYPRGCDAVRKLG